MAGLIANTCRLALVLAVGIAAAGVMLLGFAYPVLGIALVALALFHRRRRRHVTDAYGSATVASVAQMDRGGLLAADGIILGRCLQERPSLAEGVGSLLSPAVRGDIAISNFFAATYSKRWLSERLIRTNNHIHIATFSPSGGGKGVAAAIPNLLAHPGNWVVGDPKGELYRECGSQAEAVWQDRLPS